MIMMMMEKGVPIHFLCTRFFLLSVCFSVWLVPRGTTAALTLDRRLPRLRRRRRLGRMEWRGGWPCQKTSFLDISLSLFIALCAQEIECDRANLHRYVVSYYYHHLRRRRRWRRIGCSVDTVVLHEFSVDGGDFGFLYFYFFVRLASLTLFFSFLCMSDLHSGLPTSTAITFRLAFR